MRVPLRDLAGASLGIEFALSIVLTAAGGRWLDGRLHTEPTFLLVGFALGAAAGFRAMYRFAKRSDEASTTPPTAPPTPPEDPPKNL